MKFPKYFIILFQLIEFSYSFETLKIIEDFFKLKYIQNGVLINCQPPSKNIQDIKELTKNNVLQISVFEPENILVASHFHLQHSFKTAVILNADCENSNNFVNNISEVYDFSSVFNSSFHWLILGNKLTAADINFWSDLNLNIDAEIFFGEKIKNDEYKIIEIYNTGRRHNGVLTVKSLGYWNEMDGFVFDNFQYKYVRRADMSGVILKCMVVVTKKIQEPFTEYIIKPVETHIDSMNRFNYALLLHVRDIYNFSYDMKRTNSWGYLHNGTFDGMVGQLERRHIDIGGSPIFFRIERFRVVDYTTETWISRPCFIFRHPKQRASVFTIYSRPFETRVWYCSIAMTGLVIISLYSFTVCQNDVLLDTSEEKSLSAALLFTLGAMFQQGTSSQLNFMSGKMIILTIFIFSVLFYQFYTASIVSALLMESPKTIRTLKDLLDSNLKAGIEDIIYNIDYFTRTNDPVALELYSKKIVQKNKVNLFSPEEGLKYARAGGFAFHTDIATAYKIIEKTFTEKQICELSEVQLFPPQKMVAIVQKGSPFKKLVSYGLRKTAERGLMSHQRSVWHEKQPQCVHKDDPSEFTVTIKEFSPTIVFLVVGALTAVSILLIEIYIDKRNKAITKQDKTVWKINYNL